MKYSLVYGFEKVGLPLIFVQLFIDKKVKDVCFVLDTNSSNSILFNSIIENREHLDYKKSLNLTFYFEKENYTDSFNVSDEPELYSKIKSNTGVQIHGILGVDFLFEYGLTIDFWNYELRSNAISDFLVSEDFYKQGYKHYIAYCLSESIKDAIKSRQGILRTLPEDFLDLPEASEIIDDILYNCHGDIEKYVSEKLSYNGFYFILSFHISKITKCRKISYESYIRHFNKFFSEKLNTHSNKSEIFMDDRKLLWKAFDFATDNYTQLRTVLLHKLMERIIPKINADNELEKQLDCKYENDNQYWHSLSIMEKLAVIYQCDLLSISELHEIFEYLTNILCSEIDTLKDCEKNILLCTNDYKLEESNALPGVVWEYPLKNLNKTIIDGFIRNYIATYTSETIDGFYEEAG